MYRTTAHLQHSSIYSDISPSTCRAPSHPQKRYRLKNWRHFPALWPHWFAHITRGGVLTHLQACPTHTPTCSVGGQTDGHWHTLSMLQDLPLVAGGHSVPEALFDECPPTLMKWWWYITHTQQASTSGETQTGMTNVIHGVCSASSFISPTISLSQCVPTALYSPE